MATSLDDGLGATIPRSGGGETLTRDERGQLRPGVQAEILVDLGEVVRDRLGAEEADLGVSPASGDAFGFALTAGKFGKSPEADLAIGVPGADRSPDPNTGDVHVLYGSATGVTTAGAQLWNQDSAGIEDAAEPSDAFGGIPVPLRGRR